MNNEEKLENLSHKSLSDPEKETVRSLLLTDPELWQTYGDLSEWTRSRILDGIEPDTVQYECTVAGIQKLRQQLLNDGDTALERLAVEQIITNHIQVARSGYQLENIDPTKELTEASRHWSRTHNLAQGRLLRSMATLTRLRKLDLEISMKRRKYRTTDYPTKIQLENPEAIDSRKDEETND